MIVATVVGVVLVVAILFVVLNLGSVGAAPREKREEARRYDQKASVHAGRAEATTPVRSGWAAGPTQAPGGLEGGDALAERPVPPDVARPLGHDRSRGCAHKKLGGVRPLSRVCNAPARGKRRMERGHPGSPWSGPF
jgi:hypothetical protein